MSYEESVPVVAGADLNTSAHQFHALAVAGTIAANSGAAIGLLQNKPKSGEDAQVSYAGRSRYRAGAAVAANASLMVTASGWVITATSGSAFVGKALAAVSSGGIGEGIFNFASGYAPA